MSPPPLSVSAVLNHCCCGVGLQPLILTNETVYYLSLYISYWLSLQLWFVCDKFRKILVTFSHIFLLKDRSSCWLYKEPCLSPLRAVVLVESNTTKTASITTEMATQIEAKSVLTFLTSFLLNQASYLGLKLKPSSSHFLTSILLNQASYLETSLWLLPHRILLLYFLYQILFHLFHCCLISMSRSWYRACILLFLYYSFFSICWTVCLKTVSKNCEFTCILVVRFSELCWLNYCLLHWYFSSFW